ncbi:MAG: hypothetical protein IJQ07_01485 [Clostridia bacterium]|nr:hypothetical protein [Clostridia bacterium]
MGKNAIFNLTVCIIGATKTGAGVAIPASRDLVAVLWFLRLNFKKRNIKKGFRRYAVSYGSTKNKAGNFQTSGKFPAFNNKKVARNYLATIIPNNSARII